MCWKTTRQRYAERGRPVNEFIVTAENFIEKWWPERVCDRKRCIHSRPLRLARRNAILRRMVAPKPSYFGITIEDPPFGLPIDKNQLTRVQAVTPLNGFGDGIARAVTD